MKFTKYIVMFGDRLTRVINYYLSNVVKVHRLIFIMIFIVFIGSLSFHVFDARFALESMNWKETNGQIITTWVKTRYIGKGGSSEFDHQPQVLYRYTVEGITYQSSSIYPGGGGFPRFSVYSDVISFLNANYPKGDNVTVYYDPSDHSQSALKIGLLDKHYGNFIVDGLLLFIGLLVLVVGRVLFIYQNQRNRISI